MKSIVRDDIIKLESYVDAEFKYKKYLEIIGGCGGYCFLEQFERLWESEGGKYLAKKMEDSKLIKTDYFSRYKFVRLTSTALKYLYYRDSQKDFSDVPKNSIPIQNLKNSPSEKVLFASAIYFELYHKNMPYFSKEKHIELLEDQFSKSYNQEVKKEEDNINEIRTNFNHLEVCKRLIQEQIEVEEENNKRISMLIDSFEEEKSRLSHKKGLLNKYVDEIQQVESWQKKITEILNFSNYASNSMNRIEKMQDDFRENFKNTTNEIENLKRIQQISNQKRDNIIKKFIELRDISKIVCIYDKKKMKLTVFSTFIKNNRGNYSDFLTDLSLLLYHNGFFVKEAELILASIYEIESKAKDAIKKEVTVEGGNCMFSEEEHYDKSIFDESIPRDSDYIEWRDGSLREVLLKKTNYSVGFHTLNNLQKYFDTISDSVNYIKKDHLEQFQELKDKLSKK